MGDIQREKRRQRNRKMEENQKKKQSIYSNNEEKTNRNIFRIFPSTLHVLCFFLSIHLNSFFLLFLKRSFTFCTKPPDKSYLSRHTDNFTVSKTITKWTNESKTVRHLKVIYQSHKIIKWVFNLKNKTNTFFVNNLYITWLWNYFI